MSGSEVKYSVNQQLLSNEDGGGRRTRGPGLSLQVGQTDGPGHTERLKGPEERVGGGVGPRRPPGTSHCAPILCLLLSIQHSSLGSRSWRDPRDPPGSLAHTSRSSLTPQPHHRALRSPVGGVEHLNT